MAVARKFNTSFLGGEVSDRYMARVDTELYDKTLRILENFIIHPTGGLDFDPGTVFICEAKTNTGPVRLLPFEKSSSEKYVLELSELACRFYKDKARLMDGGNPLEIVTPWLGADLKGLQTAQNETKIYLAHEVYQIRCLRIFGELNWSLTDANMDVSLAVAHGTTPYVTVYSYSSDIFYKRPNPDILPTGTGMSCCFSTDGIYFVVAHATHPFFSIYKRNGDSFTKLANPGTLPTSTGRDCAFSPDGIYLAIGQFADAPLLMIYKRSGDTFTKLSDPATPPAGPVRGCDFSPDGQYLATAHSNTPYVTIYKRSGDTFAKLDNPVNLPTGQGNACVFSPDGTYLVVAHETLPYITIYKRNGDNFIKLADPSTLPTGSGMSCAFSFSGAYLAVGHGTTPFVTIYKCSGDSFSKLSNPAIPPATAGLGCSFSLDNIYLAVSHDTTPFVTIYKRNADTFTKIANPATLPAAVGNGCFFVPDAWEGVSWGSKFPKTLTFHDQRLLLGRDGLIMGSRIGWPQNFALDPADSSYGFEYSLASDILEEILWMRTKAHNIVVGTTLGEWLLTGGDAPITGSNIYADRVSAHGSAELCAILVNESLLYVQKGGQRLREFMYSYERGGYISPDLTLLADHIGELGFSELAWQRSPFSMLWIPQPAGGLTSLTLDRNDNIVAWGRHPRDGLIKSMAIVSGDASNGEDTIYLCVQRVINGVTKQYIEYMTPQRRPADEKDYHFVDCGKIYDYSATQDAIIGATKANPVVVTAGAHPFVNDEKIRITGVVGMTQLNGNIYTVKNKAADNFELYDEPGTTPVNGLGFGTYVSGGLVEKVVKILTGLDHLEAKTLAVYADGVALGNEVVAAGAITIDAYAAKIHVGLPYTGKMWTQRLGHFSPVRIPEATLLLYKSRGGKIGSDAGNLMPIRYASSSELTGPQEVRIGGRFSKEGSIMIVQDQPLPMTVLGIVGDMSVGE